jgi:tetratricopeptide (TPR) repeat protein
MRALVVCLASVRIADAQPRFEPPPVPAAAEHYAKAKEAYAAKQFAAAADEFGAALDLDPESKFLLFDRALALRMAGSCAQAIELYKQFLAAAPPPSAVDNANIGIARCQALIDAQRPIEPPPVVKPRAARPPQQPPTPPPSASARWYADGTGDALAIGGAALLVSAVVLRFVAASDADATYHPRSLTEWQDSRAAAQRYETLAWISAGVGAALVAGGLAHYWLRGATIAAGEHGVAVAVKVRF